MSDPRMPRTRRRWLGWTIGGIAVLLLCAIGWVAVRGVGAVMELQQVQRTAGELRSAISTQDVERAEHVGARIAGHASSAHELTSDPVWRAFELVPWLGPNFTAMREVAAVADTVADDALSPVLEAAADLDLAGLGFADGRLDVQAFISVREPLGEAAQALSEARTRSTAIDAPATLPPLEDAIVEMRDVIAEATGVVEALHNAALLLPPMLGADEPRYYIVAMQNNAELRSSGGIVGAFALVKAEHGEISLISTAATPDFTPRKKPFAVEAPTAALFGDDAGKYTLNATNAPAFAEAANLLSQHWLARFDQTIDGVIAVDAVVAAHLVEANGPMEFGQFQVDGDNVVDVLLSEVYASIDSPYEQDKVFAEAAAGLFDAALHADDPRALLTALERSSSENRIRIWSAHADEQRVLETSTLGGGIPSDEQVAHVGVLLNDTTGAKMDYYATASAVVSIGECHGEPTTRVAFTFSNDAPADAASLPRYVTGGGKYGVEPGSARTLIALYGPEGALPVSVNRDGRQEPVQSTTIGTRTVIQHEVVLTPGESTTITIDFAGGEAGRTLTELVHTPMVGEVPVTFDTLECGA